MTFYVQTSYCLAEAYNCEAVFLVWEENKGLMFRS
uniref:Uncharacterized protein n=1 Tax=Anguilla anguilla TaxID=7936 RepID=A0A0E9SB70_ANGAN